ncbi:uncharacterized protein PG998_004273 [Apiospora kogelbergensis]|uniref:uncharacterized protein n=1 Tax=Apiospora kogelbergensis TaxID=1337665 RepID=UPI00312E0203
MSDPVADYIVVGGGLTGCLVASRLSQSAKSPRVVLLEAGSDPSSNPAAAGLLSGLSLLGGGTEPVPETAGRVHTLNVGKALGGGSVLNYGGWLRADAADYDDWADVVGDARWSYEGIKPWLRKSERFFDAGADADEHGFDGPMHVVSVSASESGARQYPLRQAVRDAWGELGMSLNPRKDGTITGVAEFYENSRDGMRQPSNMAYPLDKVHVHTNTVVRRVTFAEGVATGVELADGRRMAAREIIICAGAFRTPQVLMLSGIGPSATLKEHDISLVYDAPDVGQNLYDHFALFLAHKLRDPSLGYAFGSASWTDPALFKSLPWDWVVSQPLPKDILKKHEPDAKRQDRNLYEVITLYVPPGIPGIPMDGTHIATSTMLLRPTSRGTVSIRSADPNDAPVIQLNHFSTAFDRDTLVHAAGVTMKALTSTKALGSVVEGESPPSGEGLDGLTPLAADSGFEELEQRIRQTGMAHAHPGGTAAMGKVVDAEGRVLGATLYAMAEQLTACILGEA